MKRVKHIFTVLIAFTLFIGNAFAGSGISVKYSQVAKGMSGSSTTKSNYCYTTG